MGSIKEDEGSSEEQSMDSRE